MKNPLERFLTKRRDAKKRRDILIRKMYDRGMAPAKIAERLKVAQGTVFNSLEATYNKR